MFLYNGWGKLRKKVRKKSFQGQNNIATINFCLKYIVLRRRKNILKGTNKAHVVLKHVRV